MRKILNILALAVLATALLSLGAAPAGAVTRLQPNGCFAVHSAGVDDDDVFCVNGDGTVTMNGQAITGALQNPGRGFFQICGDAATVNNNTVYYGPSTTLTASIPGGRGCDITAAGNITEAIADEPVFSSTAFQVLGMQCYNQADQDANISYTLRSAAAATTPSVTCTIADNARDCQADVQTTTAVAAAATVAIAVASSLDVGLSKGFNCTVLVAY